VTNFIPASSAINHRMHERKDIKVGPHLPKLSQRTTWVFFTTHGMLACNNLFISVYEQFLQNPNTPLYTIKACWGFVFFFLKLFS